MGYMTLQINLPDNAYAELTGPDIKYWPGEGLPEYEGGIDGFAECYPEMFALMVRCKYVKPIPDDDPAPM